MLKIIFVAVASIFFTGLLVGKLFVFGKKNPTFVGRYAASLAGIVIFYCIFSLLLMPQAGTYGRLIFLFFAASPFIIGRLTTYKTVNFFTIVQLVIAAASIVYTINSI